MRHSRCAPGLVAIASLVASATGAELPALRQVGLCTTGFGVPGSARPLVVGDLVLINAGEGYPTIIGAADKRNPRVLRYIPSWYFTSAVYPLPSRDLTYLSSSRGRLLVLRGLTKMATEGELKEIPWDGSKWGRSFLSALRPDGIAYTVVNKEVIVLDLNDPDHPREVARVPQPRLRDTKALGGAGLLAFSDDFALAAGLLDGGLRVGLFRWKSPTETELLGEFSNAEVHDKMGAAAYGRVLAFDHDRLVIGHPASTSKYWHCLKLTFWDVRDPAKPRRACEKVLDAPGTHIRDLVLAGRYAFVADGREISSGHTVHRGQHSRLYVLDTKDLEPGRAEAKGDDLALEVEAVGSPKTVAVWEDPMPTEYSRLSLQGGLLYVNDYNYGLWVFDVSDPLKPAKLGGVPTSAEGHWLYLHKDHAFMAHTFGGTIHVINVADPAKPRTVGYYWDGQWLNYKARIRGVGDAMYVPQEDGLAIVNIADPTAPKRVGEFLGPEGQPLYGPCLDVSEAHAFVAAAPRGKTPCRLLVYEVTTPLAPALVSTTELSNGKGFRVLRAGTMLYLVGFTGGRLMAVDVSDPKKPRVTADLQAAEVRFGERTLSLALQDGGGNGAPGVAFSHGYLYVVTALEAPNPYLLIYDVRDPAAIRPVGTLDVTDRRGWQYFICDVIAEGNRLYIGDYGCEEVYDIAEPLSPKRIARYRRSYSWQVGVVRDGLLYVPKLDGLEILRLPGR